MGSYPSKAWWQQFDNSQQSCWKSGMYVWNLNYTQLEKCRWQILPPVNTYIEHPPFLDHFPNGNHTFCFCYLMVHLSLPATRRSDARKLQGDWRTTSGGNAVNLKQPSALNMSQYWDMVYWDIIIYIKIWNMMSQKITYHDIPWYSAVWFLEAHGEIVGNPWVEQHIYII